MNEEHSLYERQMSAFEAHVDAYLFGRASRPQGFKWEDHRDQYLDFDPDDDDAVNKAVLEALADWFEKANWEEQARPFRQLLEAADIPAEDN